MLENSLINLEQNYCWVGHWIRNSKSILRDDYTIICGAKNSQCYDILWSYHPFSLFLHNRPIPDAKSPWRLVGPIYVGSQYWDCFMSPSWHLLLWGGSYISRNFVHMWSYVWCGLSICKIHKHFYCPDHNLISWYWIQKCILAKMLTQKFHYYFLHILYLFRTEKCTYFGCHFLCHNFVGNLNNQYVL